MVFYMSLFLIYYTSIAGTNHSFINSIIVIEENTLYLMH
jgi:hypothetical protein